MRHWPLWTLRRSALCYWLAVDLVAIAAGGWVLRHGVPPDTVALGRFTAIAVTAGTVIIGTSVVLQFRGESQRNLWAIHTCYLAAGVLTLPANLLVLLLLGPALHGVLSPRTEVHRWVFGTGAMTIATFASRLAVGWHEPRWDAASLVFAAAVLPLTRAGVVAVGLRLRSPTAPADEVLGDPIDIAVGVVAGSLGGLLATAVLQEPVLALLTVAPMVLLERSAQLPHWRRWAQRDAKTGLSNAMHWDNVARTELARMNSRRLPTAVLLIDLDHFKRVNDQIGHLAGDAALSAVAALLRSNVRRGDIVGRFGGEEFVALLPHATPHEAESVAQRLRLGVAGLEVPTITVSGDAHQLSGLTASIGVATSARFGYELPELLSAADSALLYAKGAGRNLVTMA